MKRHSLMFSLFNIFNLTFCQLSNSNVILTLIGTPHHPNWGLMAALIRALELLNTPLVVGVPVITRLSTHFV